MNLTTRTHKLQLDSVTLNFRLWDGPPSIEGHDPRRFEDTPEYTNGRYFATVEVFRDPLGAYIRTLNEKSAGAPGIHRSLSPQELRAIANDIDDAVSRVQAAGFLEEWPNTAWEEAKQAAEQEAEEEEYQA